MKPITASLAVMAVLCGVLVALAMPAHAQARSEADIHEQYQADRAACLGRHTGEDLQTCLREAGAAAQAAGQGRLMHENEEAYRQNALARCEQLPPENREACRLRIKGAGSVSGSVRETVRASVEEGGPTFTPVRPAIPGRTPAETPSAAPAADTPSDAAPGMLQISPPATPVLQVPEPPPQRRAASPAESTR